MENLIDLLGETAMVAAVLTPFIIMPLVWKYLDESRSTRIVTGLLLSAVIFFLLFCISMAICLRNGLGPG